MKGEPIFIVELEAQPSDIPGIVRLRRFLKGALRNYQLSAVSVSVGAAARQAPPEAPPRQPTRQKLSQCVRRGGQLYITPKRRPLKPRPPRRPGCRCRSPRTHA